MRRLARFKFFLKQVSLIISTLHDQVELGIRVSRLYRPGRSLTEWQTGRRGPDVNYDVGSIQTTSL